MPSGGFPSAGLLLRTAAATAVALMAALPAAGQNLPANPPLPPVAGALLPAVPPAPDPDGLPPYEPQMERLAERLGTLALMRDLCRDGDAAQFRDRMAALLDAEARTPSARDRLAGAFNRGVGGYAATYRSCTPSARLVIVRTLAEADRLTRDLASRYGGT
jgi:uncharacterized protein (TIGR02301 family)